jgi:predicted Fe-S protein YdhL (DUF1289 family)
VTDARTVAMPSPCTGICRLDEATGYCLGCGRSASEIAEWSGADGSRRREIWARLPERFAALDIAVTRLPWGRDEITAFIHDTLRPRTGTWVLGCHGATAEFMIEAGEAMTAALGRDEVVATTAQGGLRFRLLDNLRALQLRDPRAPDGTRAIFLAIPKPKNETAATPGLTIQGADRDAIQAAHREQAIFDLGLARAEMRFMVRTGTAELRHALTAAQGLTLDGMLARVGPMLLRAGPTRVVETVLGRIEVYAPIPAPGGKSPPGPHTHLLPQHLAMRRATMPGIDLPNAYTLCATFYPRSQPGDEICKA